MSKKTSVEHEEHPDIFSTVPLSIYDFIISDEHMAFPTISERQFRALDFMIGRDPYKVFDNGRYLATIAWGKGSGKDTIVVLIFCYIIYYLLCLKNPQQFLGLVDGDNIDLINVAGSKEQAKDVFFDKLKNRLKLWKWLGKNYTITYSSSDNVNKDKVVILRDTVSFPRNITLYSGHSEVNTLEGKSLLAFVMDEASAMQTSREDKAEGIYRMLRTSAASRFGLRYKGFIISYPRSKNDFTLNKFIENLGNLNVYTDKACTWEVKPKSCYSGPTFKFKGYDIPIEFKEDFEKDPVGSMTCYMCTPMEVEKPFVEFADRIDVCCKSSPIGVFDTYTDGMHIKKRLVHWNHQCSRPHIIGVDLGLKIDSAVISMMHFERTEDSYRYVQDLLLAWEPNSSQGLMVSLKNVSDIICMLASRFKVSGVVFDRWNSAMMVEDLNSKGIPSYDMQIGLVDYQFVKDLMYCQKLDLVFDEAQLTEWKRLVRMRDGKIDHLPQFSKDRVDAVVCAIRYLRENELKMSPSNGDWESFTDIFSDPAKGGFTTI